MAVSAEFRSNQSRASDVSVSVEWEAQRTSPLLLFMALVMMEIPAGAAR